MKKPEGQMTTDMMTGRIEVGGEWLGWLVYRFGGRKREKVLLKEIERRWNLIEDQDNA